eukprot:TRINITY_DN4813_c0_g1_i1.p1 TRINITY_DN4813_c0_g1~~TRINITY_DN4813_c0_g1_i1.p1  ORF type:complete len:385 (+),score=121.51 TRINITY_DN4813_c0_g1_i1:295-1449(+)
MLKKANFVDPAIKIAEEILPKESLPGVESSVPQFNYKELYFEVDDEIVQALEGESDDEVFGELDDDFVTKANQFEDANEEEEHRKRRVQFGVTDDEEIVDEYEEDDRVRVDVERDIGKQSAQRQIMEERFENVLNQYDDDQIGELEEGFGGKINVEDLDDVLDDFLDYQANNKILLTGERGKRHGIKENEDEDTDDSGQYESEEGEEGEETNEGNAFSDTRSTRSSASRPTKIWDTHIQKYLDGTAATSEKVQIEMEEDDEEEEKWDCESIISTYSNLENHPKLIVEESKRKIKLSNKSGLPVGVLPQKPKKKMESEIIPENKGVRRNREETKEEKKLRKNAIKEERSKQRELKKDLRVAFKNEKLNQQQQFTPTTGLSTIRIS